MTAIGDQVDQLYDRLARLGRSVVDRRRPGLPPGALAAGIEPFGLIPPADLAALYTAADGIDSTEKDILDDLHVIPGYYWMPLEEALLHLAALREAPDWSPDWFPFLTNGGGDFYAMFCGADPVLSGGVLGYLRGEPGTLVEFRSLGTMLATILASFDAGAFYLYGERLETDYPRMREIARQTDPSFIPIEIGGTGV